LTAWSLDQAAAVLGGEVVGDGTTVPVALAMDSRSLLPGSCFLAIRGQRDGHEFAAQAVERGAASLLVDHELPLDVPQLLVADTVSALHRWGQARLEAVRPRAVFAITGSVGKTSTKELLAAATAAWKTPGNRNNTFGLPEALATLPAGLDAAVLEMGMSTPFEIAKLTEIAPPDFGLITNIGTAHMENFVKGQEGIARAKGELVAGLKPGGTWVHLAADSWCRWVALQPWASRARAVAVGQGGLYGWEGERSLGPHGEQFTLRLPGGSVEVRLRMRGSHQVRNAALAGTLAVLAGFEPGAVARGLGTVEPDPGRGRLHALKGGGWLLDESYNASQDSILACAASLGDLEGGPTVVVLGSMRELGPRSESLHRETGEGLRALGLTRLLAYGDQAQALVQGFGPGGQAFPDYDGVRDDPAGLASIPEGARILVKGSRYWQAERAVAWLLEHLGTH
jgi:UDP-N-acetylmuramoyl-tripeptide--D-alanyl-D-alanine ligase